MSTYTYTYDIVTPESAEQGDSAEGGYWMPGGWTYPIKGDYERSVLDRNLADAKAGDMDFPSGPGWLKDICNTLGGMEVQTCGQTVTGYEIDGEQDYRTGAYTRRAVHIECPTESSARRVARCLEA